MAPTRIQRSHTKGWRMPEGAIYVGRPTKWGNPFPITGDWIPWAAVAIGFRADKAGRLAASLEFYRQWLTGERTEGPHMHEKADDLIVYEGGYQVDTLTQARRLATGFAAMMNRMTLPVPPTIDEIRAALQGHDLACWCPLDRPCHADVLLRLANA